MSTRLLRTTFGSTKWDSGVIDPNLPVASPLLAFNEGLNDWMAAKAHNDAFAVTSAGAPAKLDGIHFASSDIIDLRDFIDEGQCLDDIVVNIQRQQELPYAATCYNLSPVNALYETLIITQMELQLSGTPGSNESVRLDDLHSIGFNPQGIEDTVTGNFTYQDVRQDALIYVETRKYSLDGGQQWSSPEIMPAMNGPTGAIASSATRWTSDFALAQRTVRGNPDLVVGPGLQVIRVWSMWPSDRTAQGLQGGGAGFAAADEFQFNSSRLLVTLPALQVNIIGNQRDLTATEKAVWYSNILLA
tara:strand:+ start:1961 stop:2866 length:906 start_codon:yes stop_codon:yes gene_type:complete